MDDRPTEPLDVVRTYFRLMDEAIAKRDPEITARRLALVADDIVYQNKPLRVVRGKPELLRWHAEFAGCEYMRGTINYIAQDRDRVLTERTEEWRINGITVGGDIMGIFEVRDGLIWSWYDHLSYIEDWRSSGQFPPEFFERWSGDARKTGRDQTLEPGSTD